LSNSEKIANPRFFRVEERELARVQPKLSKAEKGSRERAKRRKVVSRVQERIANRRSNFAHQESRKLVNRFGILVFEDLNTLLMLKNHCLAKSIADAAWNQFVLVTTSKAEEAGRRVVLVDPRNTSKRCSRCGQKVEKDLSIRVHSCPVCGLILDRDQNAAINILALGLQCLGEDP
jgi:putative transposase